MSKIQYMLKPDWVSWDDVQECQMKAHEMTNNAKGFHMTVQDYSGEQLKNSFGKDGYCFVALDDKRVVGVHGLIVFIGSKWWSKGKKVAYHCMDAILPEYQGTDVYLELQALRNKYDKQLGTEIIQFTTAEQNKVIRKIAQKRGAKTVMYSATCKGANYYSVVMVKWVDGCPYSDRYINFMFKLSKYVIKTLWKPGYKFRFWF